jgi:tetratricopeptide (TPR) repeat protein
MKPRPTIFLSGVSHEFGSFRDAVEIEIQKKGCFVENQSSSFETDYRTVEEMLRRKLSEADAVIHIVGFRYGAEPHGQPADKPRRSYTQLEFAIARELNKPIFIFLSQDATVRDPPKPDEKPEDNQKASDQLAHRDAIKNANYLYYYFKDTQDLCRLAGSIQPVAAFEFRAEVSRIDKFAPAKLVGRDEELALLDAAWLKVQRAESPRARVITFVALGGEGKTSLVANWTTRLSHRGWPGCDAAFAWSFFNQGTREQVGASSDLFFKEAITFFGDESDKEFAASSAGAYEKGQRLARIVGERNNLLILDGLEPLQYAPTSPTAGELKDPGIAALLKGLAANSKGLCIVTTRYSLPELTAFQETSAPEVKLHRLSRDAGVYLLKLLGVKGSSTRNIPFNDGRELINEFEKLVEDVKGHALTLNLLGTYLHEAHGGDIRRRDLVSLEEADAEERSGHSFRVMEAYEDAFKSEGEKGERALATLRLLGLFDRPATADCLTKLLEEPVIPNLTEPLATLSDAQWNLVLKRLDDAKLLTVNRDGSGELVSLDAHPLLREYFARRLRKQQPDAWCAAHRRLYDYLSQTTENKPAPTLEDLEPLHHAVAHGCRAGLLRQALALYLERIMRGNEFYSTNKLGAYGSALGALASFFEVPWSRVSSAFNETEQTWLLNSAAFTLRSLGRLTEAIEPMSAAMKLSIKNTDYLSAAILASNLSEAKLTLGKVLEAISDAELSIKHADTFAEQGGDPFQSRGNRTTLGDALYLSGQFAKAETRFREAEEMQVTSQPERHFLYSLQGFRYCNFLLAGAERAAWQRMLDHSRSSDPASTEALRSIYERATQTLTWMQEWSGASLFTIVVDKLTLCRVALYEAVLSAPVPDQSALTKIFDYMLKDLRNTGVQLYIPLGLLARAWLRCLAGAFTGPDSAQEDLDQAWEIAERGPMRLHMADIHLYRARLFFRESTYPWGSAKADLEAAETLIDDCGYHRRDEELADVKRVILGS